ncbi:hypothetical protein CG51_17365 [Haematobacter missouriensis]|uniref:Histidine phosphatase family protein n=1 Tax=Haematobacter missouriensis TaxID=366616 RepID=A0A212AND5_9RHOB|nr:histidine phosphatase family protein [Haematobacter missouriensis]KFI24807.1 hypothetical protein CG51_17365 [Haematobacter missouriensis]OWJ76918.1 histidine phosphatase family protein [Haematobacter missouriensis]OWJ83007.1 histidine phosphatase family protein [Haematobacter missouriensis]
MSRVTSTCAAATYAFALAASLAAPASAATFLFIRHAESTSNAGTATTVEENLDPPLTPLGKEQAVDLAAILDSYDVTAIYTSAYQRTQLTIAPTAAEFGLTPTVDARTNEWYLGDVMSLEEMAEVNAYGVIGAWAAGDHSAKANLPNAESLDDMAARVIPAWQEITRAHKDDKGVVLLVGHGAEIGFVMPYFAQNVSFDFAFANGLHNTGIVQLEFRGDQPVVTNWQGTDMPAAVPLPASGLLLLGGAGVLLARGLRRVQSGAA